jgi:hypothetical protein
MPSACASGLTLLKLHVCVSWFRLFVVGTPRHNPRLHSSINKPVPRLPSLQVCSPPRWSCAGLPDSRGVSPIHSPYHQSPASMPSTFFPVTDVSTCCPPLSPRASQAPVQAEMVPSPHIPKPPGQHELIALSSERDRPEFNVLFAINFSMIPHQLRHSTGAGTITAWLQQICCVIRIGNRALGAVPAYNGEAPNGRHDRRRGCSGPAGLNGHKIH